MCAVDDVSGRPLAAVFFDPQVCNVRQEVGPVRRTNSLDPAMRRNGLDIREQKRDGHVAAEHLIDLSVESVLNGWIELGGERVALVPVNRLWFTKRKQMIDSEVRLGAAVRRSAEARVSGVFKAIPARSTGTPPTRSDWIGTES